MSRFPYEPAFQYPPGRVVRKRELDAIASFIEWLKAGLRPQTKRTIGVLYGQSAGASIGASGDLRVLTNVDDYAWILFPHMYIGDRIIGYGASILRGNSTGKTLIELVRIPWAFTPDTDAGETWADAVEVLDSFEHTGSLAVRELQGSAMTPITVETGYFYRVRATAKNSPDWIYGAYVDTDHPTEG